MEYFSRTPIKNDVLGIISQFVEFTPEKLCVDKCQKKYSSYVKINETHTSEIFKLNVETTSLTGFSPEASSDFPLTNLYGSAFDNSPDAQSLAHISPIVKYSPEASPKTGTVAHTSLKIDSLFNPNNKSNVSSGDDDDDAFERFIESQKKTKITKSEDDQSSDWLSGESEEDDDSSSTSPYQTFYYRIHNQVDSSEVRKPSYVKLHLFDSDFSESDRENSSSVKNNQPVTIAVPKRLDVTNCHKSTKKDGKPNLSDVPVEEFVYSLYPVSDNDRKSTAQRKIRHPDALK
ncbi:unnamed protein product [Trichobilharzia regenti]|nr:unnamed protein product [Trichobilharzia regenti]